MNLFKDAREYILENNLKIIYQDNKVNIVNYKSVLGFDSNKVIVELFDKTVLVSGENLVISRLLLDELLISGNIQKLEFR